MQIINISEKPNPDSFSLFNLGFRPFFLCAGIFAILAVMTWLLVYTSYLTLPLTTISPSQWHAHEMVYGFSLAVVAGFLLTATKNWTGVQTVHGVPLMLLVSLWLAARILLISGFILFAGVADLAFLLFLTVAIIYPIVLAKQWQQLAVATKLIVLMVGNTLFYLGAMGIVQNGITLSLYGGLYLIIGLVLMIGRRVIPFFIERGIETPTKLQNAKVIDLTSLAGFLVFFVADLMLNNATIAAYSALVVFIVNVIRLKGWYHKEIWQKPLLWSLYLAICSISLGFLLYFASYQWAISPFIYIHAFSYGGIGLITLGMMARVALGHTGRNIHHPPKSLKYALIALLLGACFRVIFCAIFPMQYLIWVGLAAIFWAIGFGIFVTQYFPILTKARVDGHFG